MHLAELCIDLLHQNEEHHAEVNESFIKASSLHYWTVFGTPSIIIGSFSNDDGDVKDNGQKVIGLDWQTTTLHVHHAFLYIFLPSLHGYDDVKVPMQIHLFWRTWKNEHKTITLISFSWFSIQSLRMYLQKKIGNIWRIERGGISVKFEAAQIHFLKWRFHSRRLRWCLSSRFLVPRFLATTLRLAFGSLIYPHPSPPFIVPLIYQCDRCLVPLALELMAGRRRFASHGA